MRCLKSYGYEKHITDKYQGYYQYVCQQLNFDGGGCWWINDLGLAQIDYCARESNLKIFWVNVKLFIFWVLRKY